MASLSQGRTSAAQCGLFTHKSVPVIFEPPCKMTTRGPCQMFLTFRSDDDHTNIWHCLYVNSHKHSDNVIFWDDIHSSNLTYTRSVTGKLISNTHTHTQTLKQPTLCSTQNPCKRQSIAVYLFTYFTLHKSSFAHPLQSQVAPNLINNSITPTSFKPYITSCLLIH